MIVRSSGAGVTAKMIQGVCQEFRKGVLPRLEKLGKAYENRGPITGRIRASGLPNNKLVHGFPRYITVMASGYLVGKPITYDDAAQKDAVEALKALFDACDMASVDAELADDASIYGRGVCIVYADEQGKPRAATLSPKEAFVVYDDTVAHNPMWGVHMRDKMREDGRRTGIQVDVYTAESILSFSGRSLSSLTQEEEIQEHHFSAVPIVEFWNNARETGDFEPVLSLIEAYDVLESDRVNDKQQFTDAILLLTGCTVENDEDEPNDKRTPTQKLMEEKMMTLPDTDAKAEWLTKKADEQGAEILRNALRMDIHKMSLVPDLTDENFASNASGVAMRYKLFGLEQLVSVKERWFREGLRSRMRLYAAFMDVLAMPKLDPDAVKITFTRSLPVNETEIAAMVAQLSGDVSKRTLLAQLPFVEDVEAEMDSLDKEGRETEARRARAFGGMYPNQQDTAGAEDEP